MKKNITIFLVMFSLLFSCTKNKEKKLQEIKVSFPEIRNINDYDTANVQLATDYTVLEHLYTNLITLNSEGQLESVLAEKFGWEDEDTIYFQLKKDLKDSLGEPLTVEDVEISFKRLLILDKNSHGKLAGLLSKDKSLKNLEEKHPSIKTVPEQNKITIDLKNRSPFIFNLFTTIDYGIIPAKSIDPNKMNISNYKRTTGPYSFSSQKQDLSDLKFAINGHYVDYKDTYPKSIELILSPTPQTTQNLVAENKIDVIPTDDFISYSDLKKLHEDYKDSFLHETRPLKLRFISFTKKGLSEFDLEQRRFLSHALRKAHAESQKGKIQPVVQFFPRFAEGSLSEVQEEELVSSYSQATKKPHRNFKIAIYPTFLKIYQEIFKSLSFVEFVPTEDIISYENNSPGVDAYIMSTDSGYHEDLSLFSYTISSGFLGHDQKTAQSIIDRYSLDPEKKSRIETLKNIHLESLTEAKVIPLSRSSYTALSFNGLKINFPVFFSNSHLWKISH